MSRRSGPRYGFADRPQATLTLSRKNDGWAFGATMLKLQADALAPIHAAAVANARRLKK